MSQKGDGPGSAAEFAGIAGAPALTTTRVFCGAHFIRAEVFLFYPEEETA